MINQEPRKGTPKRGLGRGLASLLPSAFSEELTAEPTATPSQNPSPVTPSEESVETKTPTERPSFSVESKASSPYFFCHVDDIVPNSKQPRKHFDETALAELSQSIATHGLLSPVVVRKKGPHFEIIAGERRWRAAKNADLQKIPVLLKEVGDKAQFQLALIENIQRHDLSPIEEAIGFEHLMEAYSWTQEKVAEQMGKDRTSVTNSLRLLKLPQPVIDALNERKLSMGHAKALLSISEPQKIKEIARRVIEEGWSVRMIENFARQSKEVAAGQREPMEQKDNTLVRDLEKKLESALSLKVRIHHQGQRGQLKINYDTTDQLNDFADRLGAL